MNVDRALYTGRFNGKLYFSNLSQTDASVKIFSDYSIL